MTPEKATQKFAKYPGYIRFAIVDAPSTRPGWDILDIIVADVVEGRYEAIGVAQGCPSQNNGYSNSWAASPQVMDGNRNYVVRKAQFLMGQTEKNLVEEYEAKLKTHTASTHEATKARDEATKKAINAETRASQLEADHERALKERQTLTEVKNKLEADMAKLKKMLGEKTINDVLNPPANG
jgi:hypothetical protein